LNAKAGGVTAQCAWLAALPLVPHLTFRTAAVGSVIAVVTSYLPDIEHEKATAGQAAGRWLSKAIRTLAGGHRMATHSLFALLVVWSITWWGLESIPLAWAAAIGLAGHIFTDLLTVQGVALFWPWRVKVHIGFMTTGSRMEGWYVTCMQLVTISVAALYAAQYGNELYSSALLALG
jgi:inner membrane protein